MLDCKMSTSLSPITPLNIFSESYMWEHEAMNPPPTKLESSDMFDLIDVTNLNNHSHLSNSPDCHLHSSHQYISSLSDYSSECHSSTLIDSFNHPTNIDSSFHKMSDGLSSFSSDHYENFIPDLTPNGHPTQSYHLESNGDLSSPSSYAIGESNICHSSSHQEYNWDEIPPCDSEYLFPKSSESPSTSGNYSDIDSGVDSKCSENISTMTEVCKVSPLKRRVGRPPKKDKKLKRNEKKTGRLWEFIRDLLKNPEYCPNLVRWENPEEGHFRFVNSEKVAQLWGNIKGNPRMTYEKLSRAMRYYYKSHVFEPVLGRRLVYKFGYNATNWRPQNPNFSSSLQKQY